MKVLLIKTSSLGDLLHTLPALTDAAAAIPDIKFDWVVEEGFAEIPAWHPAVDRIIPVAIRRWRKSILKTLFSGEWGQFKKELKQRPYDLIIDAQGLIKSALITKVASNTQQHCKRVGLDSDSAREPFASRFYDRAIKVEKGEHAIIRLRKLFAQALNYPLPTTSPNSAIHHHATAVDAKTILFIHGTTWVTKHWPESYWIELARLVTAEGFHIMLPWGSEVERQRAEKIAAAANERGRATVLPKLTLTELKEKFQQTSAMVAVDSGLAHLGAALAIPSVTLYGATDPKRTGTFGKDQKPLISDLNCSPCLKRSCSYKGKSSVTPACFETITPKVVLSALNVDSRLYL
ncbi:MAG: lipopolysaccharide heptosyltransferase I [Thiotrichales bacterium]|jgi:heptosyltransferase-1|nr:lipopolysaccharide heptosyltransferase I [Thiotrichales bacterium]